MITRRKFLQGLGATGIAAAGLSACGQSNSSSGPTPIPPTRCCGPEPRRGNDWLNVLPPTQGATARCTPPSGRPWRPGHIHGRPRGGVG